jgi:hypothetical protein
MPSYNTITGEGTPPTYDSSDENLDLVNNEPVIQDEPDSGLSQQCTDMIVTDVALGAGCAWAIDSAAAWAAGGPAGWITGAAVIGGTCGAALYFEERALEECNK